MLLGRLLLLIKCSVPHVFLSNLGISLVLTKSGSRHLQSEWCVTTVRLTGPRLGGLAVMPLVFLQSTWSCLLA